MALSKHSFFYDAVDKAINAFGDRHDLTGRQHFAPLLGYRGPNASIQLGTTLNYTTYNPKTPHPLSIDHLSVLLHELGSDRKVIFDAMSREFGVVITDSTTAAMSHDDVRDELMTISAIAGDLSGKFLEFKNNDGIIDEAEADELEKIALKARGELRAFEEMIHQVKE